MITILSLIFAPDINNYNRFVNSFNSIISSDLTNVNKIIIDGWVPDDNIWNSILSLSPIGDKITFFRRIHNIGKSSIINDNIPNITTDYILLLDSDIILQNSINRLSSLSSTFDIIIPNQLEDNRHYTLFFKRSTRDFENHISTGDESIFKITDPIGLAGGCIYTTTNILRYIPFSNKGSYGSDDVDFFERAITKYSIVLCENIYIIHPHDNNKKYYDWKLKTALSSYRKDLTSEEITTITNESHRFWNFK